MRRKRGAALHRRLACLLPFCRPMLVWQLAADKGLPAGRAPEFLFRPGCIHTGFDVPLLSHPSFFPVPAPTQNLIRGRGLFCRSIMKSQMASPPFTPGAFCCWAAAALEACLQGCCCCFCGCCGLVHRLMLLPLPALPPALLPASALLRVWWSPLHATCRLSILLPFACPHGLHGAGGGQHQVHVCPVHNLTAQLLYFTI